MPLRAYFSGKLYWVLTVHWIGKTFRWSTGDVHILDAAGNSLPFDGGIDPVDYEDALQGLGVASTRSISFDVLFPPDVDVALEISRGSDLASATGEVAIWSEGTLWEERRVVLVGPLREPEYGGAKEEVSFSIEEALQSSRNLTHSRQQVVSEEAWPFSDEEDWGKYYPVVFGKPGVLDNGGTCAGSPAPVVYYSSGLATKVVVAGHRVEAGAVILFNGDGNTYSFNLTEETDGLGQLVTTINLAVVSTSTFPREGSEYYASWYSGSSLIDESNIPVDTVGKLCSYLLSRANVTVDRPAWYSFDALLEGLEIGGFINDSVNPWDWIIDNILPIVPFSVLPGPDGFYPVLWKLGATIDESVCTLSPDTDTDIEREDRLTYSKLASVTNSLSFGYALDPQGGETRGRVTMGGVPDLAAGELGSYYCALSEKMYGLREEDLDSDIIWSKAPATYVLNRAVERDALPSREVSYSVPYSYGWLRLGDVVLVTDAEVHLNRSLGLVVGLRWVSEERLSVRIMLPARPELRATA